MTTRGQFKLHLPGLLKVLAEHLYSSQRIGVRELIQNSHDSCVRHSVEQPNDSYQPRIDIQIDEEARILRFADNGSGLTEEEIYHYLTVIGRGYTRELREKLSVDDPATSQQLVGQFGIGFLSAFLLAKEVTDAYELAHRSLDLSDRSHDRNIQSWHGSWRIYTLCRICYALGHLDEVADHAEDMATRSEKRDNFNRTLSSAWMWRAVTQKARGEEQNASRSFHRGLRILKHLDSRDEICAHPMAIFYELGNDYDATVGVLDRELAAVVPKGMLHRCCHLEIERCRLLSRAGIVSPEGFNRARLAANKMRIPEWYLDKLKADSGV